MAAVPGIVWQVLGGIPSEKRASEGARANMGTAYHDGPGSTRPGPTRESVNVVRAQDSLYQAKEDLNDLLSSLGDRIGRNVDRFRSLQASSNEEIFRSVSPGHRQRCNSAGEWLDPWNRPYRFAFQSDGGNPKGYGVYSFGPNQTDDNRSGDDIVAWQEVIYR